MRGVSPGVARDSSTGRAHLQRGNQQGRRPGQVGAGAARLARPPPASAGARTSAKAVGHHRDDRAGVRWAIDRVTPVVLPMRWLTAR